MICKHTFSATVVHALLCHTAASNHHSPLQRLKKGFCHYWIQYIHVTVYLKTQDLNKYIGIHYMYITKNTNMLNSLILVVIKINDKIKTAL